MIQQQLCIIRDFYESNSNPQIIKKIEKFFKDGYDGYGIETKLAEKQVNKWIKEWGGSLSMSDCLQLVEPLMLDGNEYVQKGLGTLFREMWKYDPSEIEAFLLKWKDVCGRLIIQYATEKMTPENRSKFKKSKGV